MFQALRFGVSAGSWIFGIIYLPKDDLCVHFPAKSQTQYSASNFFLEPLATGGITISQATLDHATEKQILMRGKQVLTRRHFIQTTTALFSAALAESSLANTWPTESEMAAWDAQVTPPGFDLATTNPWGLHPRLLPQRVAANDGLVPGDIHVDATARYLYHIESGGTAMRYGVAIGRDGLYQPGTYTIRRKVEWPHWTPTANMIAREPEVYSQYANGQEPGPNNALGSRALYLYVGQRDTYLRIHGTPQPWSIGSRASSGCVRMVMPHINALFPNVEIGSMARLYPA